MLHIWYEYFSMFTLSTPPLSFYFIQLAIRIWLFPSVFRLPSLLLYSIMLRRLLFLLVFLSQYKNKNNKCPKYKRERERRPERFGARRSIFQSNSTSRKTKMCCCSKRFGAVQFAFIFIDTKGLKLIDMFLVPCMPHWFPATRPQAAFWYGCCL